MHTQDWACTLQNVICGPRTDGAHDDICPSEASACVQPDPAVSGSDQLVH